MILSGWCLSHLFWTVCDCRSYHVLVQISAYLTDISSCVAAHWLKFHPRRVISRSGSCNLNEKHWSHLRILHTTFRYPWTINCPPHIYRTPLHQKGSSCAIYTGHLGAYHFEAELLQLTPGRSASEHNSTSATAPECSRMTHFQPL